MFIKPISIIAFLISFPILRDSTNLSTYRTYQRINQRNSLRNDVYSTNPNLFELWIYSGIQSQFAGGPQFTACLVMPGLALK